MISNYDIILYVDNEKKEILVKSKIQFLHKVYDLRLIINEGLVIDKIIDDKGNNIIFHEEFNINAMFIQSAKRITLEILEGTNYITIVYGGKISGWHNSISDTHIAFFAQYINIIICSQFHIIPKNFMLMSFTFKYDKI